jgi:hypothetical protein
MPNGAPGARSSQRPWRGIDMGKSEATAAVAYFRSPLLDARILGF